MNTLWRTILLLGGLLAFGTITYSLVEKVDPVTALYFTVETVTTVGYGDEAPRSVPGRVVAMVLMLAGVGAALYAFSAVASFLIEGRLRQVLGVMKMKKTIEKLSGHYIVCGYGRLGKTVVDELKRTDAAFVIIESAHEKVVEAREKGFLVVEGDATLQEVLDEAGIEQASGLATTIQDDAENLYIGITALSIRPTLNVVARSSSDRVRKMFQRAGISNIISTDEIGARRLVSSMMRPYIVEFMDHLLRYEKGKPTLQAVRLEQSARLVGETLVSSKLRDRFGVVVLAIQREGRFLPNPSPEEQFLAEDILIMVGVPEQFEGLQALVGEEAAVGGGV